MPGGGGRGCGGIPGPIMCGGGLGIVPGGMPGGMPICGGGNCMLVRGMMSRSIGVNQRGRNHR